MKVAESVNGLPGWAETALERLHMAGFTPPEDAVALMSALVDSARGNPSSQVSPSSILDHIDYLMLSASDLSGIYAQLLARKDSDSAAARKASGVFYTPTALVADLVASVLTPLVAAGKTIRVIDPAAGCGNFLQAAAALVSGNGGKVEVFGADTDAVATKICHLALPAGSFSCTNALYDLPWAGPFDAVISNPPYVFTRSGDIPAAHKTYYASRYKCGKGRISLPVLFLERGIELLRPGGRLGFVLPSTLLRAADYEPLRRLILETCRIIEIRLLGAHAFPRVNLETATLVLEREPDANCRRNSKASILHADRRVIVSQADTERRPGANLAALTESSCSLLSLDDYIPLGDLLQTCCTGIQTWKRPKSEFVSSTPLDDRYRPLVEGRDVERYAIRAGDRFILYDPRILNVAHDEAVFQSPEKILIQRVTGGRNPLKAAMDTNRLYPYNSLNTLIAKTDRLSNWRLLALLNSRLMNDYYVATYTGGARLTVNVALRNLRTLPVSANLLEAPGMEAPTAALLSLTGSEVCCYEEILSLDIPHPAAILDWVSREMSRIGPGATGFQHLDRLADLLVYSIYRIPADKIDAQVKHLPV